LSNIADAIYSVYITATEIVDQFELGTYGVTTNAERSTPSTPVLKKIYSRGTDYPTI